LANWKTEDHFVFSWLCGRLLVPDKQNQAVTKVIWEGPAADETICVIAPFGRMAGQTPTSTSKTYSKEAQLFLSPSLRKQLDPLPWAINEGPWPPNWHVWLKQINRDASRYGNEIRLDHGKRPSTEGPTPAQLRSNTSRLKPPQKLGFPAFIHVPQRP